MEQLPEGTLTITDASFALDDTANVVVGLPATVTARTAKGSTRLKKDESIVTYPSLCGFRATAT